MGSTSPDSVYRVAYQTALLPLNPTRSGGFPRDVALKLLFDTLVTTSGDFEVGPGLAERWHIDKEARRIDFFLGEARFHDGRPVTAHDVQFSLGRALQARRPSTSRLLHFREMRSGTLPLDTAIPVRSEREFSVLLAGRDFDAFLRSLSVADYGIVPRGFDEAKPVGSGRYQLQSIEAGTIVMRRAASNHPPQPGEPETIEFLPLSQSEAVDGVTRGFVHEIDTSHYPEVLQPPKGSREQTIFLPVVRLFAAGHRSAVLAKRSNRLEFAHLILRHELQRSVYPYGYPAYSTIPSVLQGFGPALYPIPSNDFLPEPGEKSLIVGSAWADDVEPLTRYFAHPRLLSRGWKVQMRKFTTTTEMYEALEAGTIDAMITGLVAKFYEPISILEVFSKDFFGCFAASGDLEFEDLVTRAREAGQKERGEYYKLADARLVTEGFAIPLLQDCNKKYVSTLRTPWVTGKNIQQWDRLGVVEAEGTSTVELNRAFSALKQASAHIGALDDELRQLATERELTRFAAQTAHDIRSPLTALAVLESLDGEFGEAERRLLRMAVGRIRDIANSLIHQVHRPTKLESVERVPVSGKGLVESVLAEKRLEYRHRTDVELVHVGDCPLRVDATECKRLLSNLLNNAFEAIEGAGRIEIRLVSDGQETRVEIADSGRGIPADVLEKLRVAGGTYGKEGGAGMGLASARERVKAWGGELSIDSVWGRGTTVTLRWSESAATPTR